MAKYWSSSLKGRPVSRASAYPFGIRRRPHGQKALLPQEDAEAFDAERPRPLRPPAIQGLLHKARDLRAELDADPDLTQAALAARMGVSRPRVTQLLRLLKLPDEAQEIILDLPPTANGCPISERALRPLIALGDPEAQLEGIRELLGDFVPVEA